MIKRLSFVLYVIICKYIHPNLLSLDKKKKKNVRHLLERIRVEKKGKGGQRQGLTRKEIEVKLGDQA